MTIGSLRCWGSSPPASSSETSRSAVGPSATSGRTTRYTCAVALAPELLEILACPQDKGPLYYLADEDMLYNPRLKRCYDVRDGIAIMLIDEARAADQAEHDRIMAKVESTGMRPTF